MSQILCEELKIQPGSKQTKTPISVELRSPSFLNWKRQRRVPILGYEN